MIWAIVVVMLAVGMVLMFAEIAIIPGFGVAGVSSALLLVGAVALAWWAYGFVWGLSALLSAVVLGVGLIALAPRTRAGRHLILESSIQDRHGDETPRLIGDHGVALTALRPAGAVELNGQRVDVVTDGRFIEAGVAVKVVAVEGARVVVAPVG